MKKDQIKIFFKISRKVHICAHYIILKDYTLKQGVGRRYNTIPTTVKVRTVSTSTPRTDVYGGY